MAGEIDNVPKSAGASIYAAIMNLILYINGGL